jgi:hypothetical protein
LGGPVIFSTFSTNRSVQQDVDDSSNQFDYKLFFAVNFSVMDFGVQSSKCGTLDFDRIIYRNNLLYLLFNLTF